MGIFTEDPKPEPTCEELLKIEQRENAELRAQINRLSLRIQEDLIAAERQVNRGTSHPPSEGPPK